MNRIYSFKSENSSKRSQQSYQIFKDINELKKQIHNDIIQITSKSYIMPLFCQWTYQIGMNIKRERDFHSHCIGMEPRIIQWHAALYSISKDYKECSLELMYKFHLQHLTLFEAVKHLPVGNSALLWKKIEKLIEKLTYLHQPMVIFFSKKYSAVYNTDISDTQQMCWMELIKSIYHYDVDMDFQFINYYIIRLKTTMLRTWGQSINIHITEEEIRKYLRFKSLLYQYNEDIDDPRFIKDCKCLFNENISELFDDYTRKENIFNISNIHNFGDTLFNETEESPDDTIDKAMQSKRVRDAINKLDPTKREILLMNYGLKDNKTYNRDQIASFLDIPLRSVRILRQEGLKELKRILNNEN